MNGWRDAHVEAFICYLAIVQDCFLRPLRSMASSDRQRSLRMLNALPFLASLYIMRDIACTGDFILVSSCKGGAPTRGRDGEYRDGKESAEGREGQGGRQIRQASGV